MKKLLFIPLMLATFIAIHGQDNNNKPADSSDSTEVIYHSKDGVVISVEQRPAVRDTMVVSYQGITYAQTRIELFNEVDLDTMYMIQYAIVSEVTSMPQHSVAIPFFTDERFMHMIISDRYYANYSEAIAIGEKVRDENPIFELYIIKPCILPKQSALIKRRNENEKGSFRIQYTWTEAYPDSVLNDFTVESYQDGFRQVSERAFNDKPQAANWLLAAGLKLKDFWIYPLEKNSSRLTPDESITGHKKAESASPEIGEGVNNEIKN